MVQLNSAPAAGPQHASPRNELHLWSLTLAHLCQVHLDEAEQAVRLLAAVHGFQQSPEGSRERSDREQHLRGIGGQQKHDQHAVEDEHHEDHQGQVDALGKVGEKRAMEEMPMEELLFS